jgi:hypothetical protein
LHLQGLLDFYSFHLYDDILFKSVTN